ncbi:hypothetical protein PR048_028766 [Dryococelus australis]|uniref:Uncharacterized protein n=1 Tax=Dryococelus australis TaxID=614101 RepID=A0ABQ9GE87_9NEOP|nr:hypothetical protein PR048_028766 [Dryococelus australis]
MRVIDVCMEQHRNEKVGETRDPREASLTNAIVRHNSHLRKSGWDSGIMGHGRRAGAARNSMEIVGQPCALPLNAH